MEVYLVMAALSVAAVGGILGYIFWKHSAFALTPAFAAEKIIATMSDALLLINTEHVVINANSAARELLGYEAAELEGMHASRIFPREWLRESILEKRGIYESVESFSDIESIVLDNYGTEIAVSLSSSNLRDHDGKLLGTICIARNISDRKKTEDLIRQQSEGLVARNAELTALFEISNAVRSTLDRDVMLKRALDTITSLSIINSVDSGGIFAVEGLRLRLLVSQGHSAEFLQSRQDLTIDDCIYGKAVKTGEIIFSGGCFDDLSENCEGRETSDHSRVILPLKAGDLVTGVLYLHLTAETHFDSRQQKLLEAIGSQLAIAMENSRLYEETRALSLHDPLTGLANRRLMSMELEKTMARANRNGKQFCLLMLDLDNFKNYNDLYGHAAGDLLLAAISTLILEEIRRIDLGARYGGEEFLLILPDTEIGDAQDVAERIRARTASASFPISDAMQSTGITVSIGVASWEQGISSPEILVARADTALYMAKSHGRNRVESWLASGKAGTV